jgi:4-amino-4-deoxy-L-arabinose transferase-like glycosyltransferase
MIARSFLQDGDWLLPKVYGAPWPEKPQLLGWINAVLAWLLGGFDERTVRIPNLVAVLVGALMVQRFVARRAALTASLLAAGSWMLAPIVLNHVVGEPDIMMTVISFGAFLVWWGGRERGRVGWGRWPICGLLLTAVAAAKGPQPVAFFALGVGGYTLLKRHWRDIPGLFCCLLMPAAFVAAWAAAVYQPGQARNWLTYMRIRNQWEALLPYLENTGKFALKVALEYFPADLLAVAWWWRRGRRGAFRDESLALALLLYAGIVPVVLLFWPGGSSRYAMPALPAAAVAAGLLLHEALAGAAAVRRERVMQALRRVTLVALGGLAAYRLVLVLVVMTWKPELFNENRVTGARIAATIAADPAPFLALSQEMHDAVWYAGIEPRMVLPAGLRDLPQGAWLMVRRDQLGWARQGRPDLDLTGALDLGDDIVLVRLR